MSKQPERVKLDYPFEVGGETVEAVSLRRPKVRDLRKIEEAEGKGEMEQGIVMIAALCDLPDDVVDEIDSADFIKISEKIEDFFPKEAGSGTGGKSQQK